jgi:hypothetical protein
VTTSSWLAPYHTAKDCWNTIQWMDRLENARLDWQRAQAELQLSLAELERRVAALDTAEQIEEVRALSKSRQAAADELLQRYITYLGKSA